jgi:cyclomaltodextrinase / maltogenic alpha-amylase / neopullulanase
MKLDTTLRTVAIHNLCAHCLSALCLLLIACMSTATAGNDPKPPRADADAFSDPPVWARDAVWYQIFPERFRNGDPSNDPTLADIEGAWPHERQQQWHISPWTADWFKLQPWEDDGRGFYYHAQLRRFGGDLQGIISRLDYLQDLGVTALYLNPIFESPSLHKYDATMYHHVDNNFGPDPAGDRAAWEKENPADPATWGWTSADKLFLSLVKEAHRRGMKVILDGVFNHVGTTFWAFKDVVKNQQASKYSRWFTITSWDDPSTPRNEFAYKGWMGVKDLPELRRDSSGMEPEVMKHVHAIVRRWMDPNGDGDHSDGIDGWRLDVAEMVPISFWREFRRWVRDINPESYITGEIWWQDWSNNVMFNAAPWLQGDAFDAVMNYRVAREACHFFKDRAKRLTPSAFDGALAAIRADYRPQNTGVLMTLYGSHDTDRLGSMIVNVDSDFDKHVGTADNPSYDIRKPRPDELRIQRLMVLFQMTYIGAPMVYYGDEVGMWGGDDPDERKPMLWSDMTYEPESHHPLGKPRPVDENAPNTELFDYYKRAIELRKAHPALLHGDFASALTDDAGDVYGFTRQLPGSTMLVMMNASPKAVTVPLPAGLAKKNWIVRFLTDADNRVEEASRVTLLPVSGIVLESGDR